MATLAAYFGLDMKSPPMFGESATVTNATATEFTIVDGLYSVTYLGTFTYNELDVFGDLDSFQLYYNGVLQSEVSQINTTIEALFLASETSVTAFNKLIASDNDIFNGSGERDVLLGYDGHDQMYGRGGNDKLIGGKGGDYLNGGNGKDKLFGGKGNDILEGGKGNDTVYGESGRDIVTGGFGNDTLFGGDGNDWLLGSDYGSSNFDKIFLYGGNDTMTGGADADTFVFVMQAGGNMTVTDFSLEDGDALELYEYGFTTAKQAKQQATMIDGDTVFDFGDGHTLTLEGFGKSDLSNANMDFYAFEDIV